MLGLQSHVFWFFRQSWAKTRFFRALPESCKCWKCSISWHLVIKATTIYTTKQLIILNTTKDLSPYSTTATTCSFKTINTTTNSSTNQLIIMNTTKDILLHYESINTITATNTTNQLNIFLTPLRIYMHHHTPHQSQLNGN